MLARRLLAEGGKIILVTLPDSLQATIHERDLQNSGDKSSQQPGVRQLIAVQSKGVWGWRRLRHKRTFNMGNAFEDPAALDTRFSSILPGGYLYSTIQHSGMQIINLACSLGTARSYHHYHSLDILPLSIIPAILLRKLQPFTQAIWHNIALCPAHGP